MIDNIGQHHLTIFNIKDTNDNQEINEENSTIQQTNSHIVALVKAWQEAEIQYLAVSINDKVIMWSQPAIE